MVIERELVRFIDKKETWNVSYCIVIRHCYTSYKLLLRYATQ